MEITHLEGKMIFQTSMIIMFQPLIFRGVVVLYSEVSSGSLVDTVDTSVY